MSFIFFKVMLKFLAIKVLTIKKVFILKFIPQREVTS